MKKNLFTYLLIVFTFLISFGQSKDDVEIITKKYDKNAINQKIVEFEIFEKKQKEYALIQARNNGWQEFIKKDDGNFQELMDITPDGFPIYYSTENQDAAISTRTNFINSGGQLGLDLNGQNMIARIWDGGTVRRTHSFFDNRITTVDDLSGNSYSAHATHVTGTILASNINPSTKGMAFQATGRTFNWTNDESEAASEALLGMLISNHSYGVPLTSSSGSTLPAWYVGTYSLEAKQWDEITFLAPYYLPVMSAGNDGNNNNNTNPIAIGYDKLTNNKTAKNILTVANAQDANISQVDGSLINVQINSSSSQGPTDDRRIKPDITGNGTNLTSSTSESDFATSTYSGTSMSSPNIAGTLLLLQQHNKNKTTSFMKAATLKGLACHTADDAGNIGPDAKFGWGLLNAKVAVEAINNNGLSSWVSEEDLKNNETYSMTVKSNGNSPLIATICWTDVPGDANLGQRPANDITPALVNNLDIKITKDDTEVFYPWKLTLNPSELATRNSDNDVDNVEQVKIDSPVSGNYTITVKNKGVLINGHQNFSLIITGVNSRFAIIPKSNDLELCSNQDAIYTFDYIHAGPGNTTFSVPNLPLGAVANFSPSSLNTSGVVTLTISNLSSVSAGDYNLQIKGDNGIETEIRTRKLKIYSTNFQPIELNTPNNNENTVSTSTILKWELDFNVLSYNVQVSTSPNFNTFLVNTNTLGNSFPVSGLLEATNYYWRVIPSNTCANGLEVDATVFNFQTGELICGNNFSATDFSNAFIANTPNSSASVPIQVSGGFTIGDLNVVLNISHTYIQDMTYTLEGPASIGSPTVMLFNQPCGDNDDINCTVDDSGINFTCASTPPAISGVVKPFENLSNFNGLIADGTWILSVDDPFNGDGGSINAVTLEFCSLQAPLSNDDFELSKIAVYPNPTNDLININLNNVLDGTTNFILYDIQGRNIIEKKSTNDIETIDVKNLTEGIYLLSISNGNIQTTRKIVVKN